MAESKPEWLGPADPDDVKVDNAPVRQHRHSALTIEGYSRAAVQSYWRVPELKIGFDLGVQPWAFMTTPNWAVSHTHLDHVIALPVYVARRRLLHMAPPTIYVPEPTVGEVRNLLRACQGLDRGRFPCQLIGCQPDDEFELSRELVLSAFATSHRVPSLGYIVWSRRKKLKAEYHDLQGEQIRDLRQGGVEVTYEVRDPLVCYLGDSNPEGLDNCPDAMRTKVLIMEITFFSAQHRRERIHKLGHIHLNDVIERADRFENELIIASHVSTRYHDDQVKRILEKRVPDRLRDRLLLWL
jgi:ribonuclease Z